jgi:TPR repeat protein
MRMPSQFGLRLVLCALAVPSLASAQGSNGQNGSLAVGISAEETLISAKKYYTAQQYSEALPLFLKAAEAGNAEAAFYLGVMYENGQGGLAKDDAQALNWYRTAADRGNASGMRNLGFMYARAKDDAQAVAWWRKAAEAGDAAGMMLLGALYAAGGGGLAKDDAQAVSWWRKAADGGNAASMASLGAMYENGRGGLAKDDAQAVSWYRKAADGGNAASMASLGAMYENGRGGLAKDDAQAVSWYRKAADAGDAYALEALKRLAQSPPTPAVPSLAGARGSNGQNSSPAVGTSAEETLISAKKYYALQQYSEALPLLLKAAEAANAEAAVYLGVMYANGQGGLAKDDTQALNWYRKAADGGNANGMGNLGRMYQNGRGGLAKDDVQAVSWYRKAADGGYANGMGDLGFMYANGRGGLAKDNAQAIAWWRKAADRGDANSMTNLGAMYANGVLTKDNAQAIAWYRKAADAGDARALEVLKRLAQSPTAPSPLDATAKFLSTPEHAAAAQAAAINMFEQLENCNDVTATPIAGNSYAREFGTPQFDAAGNLSSGLITEHFATSGCGKQHLENILTSAKDGKITVAPSIPGTTLASPVLIHDTLQYVYTAAALRNSNCKNVRIVDASFDAFEGEPNPQVQVQGTGGRPWREIWTVDICGSPAQITVNYVPEGPGTKITVKALGPSK